MEAQKTFNEEQKKMTEDLPLATSLSKLQGIKNREKEGYLKFGERSECFK